MQQGMFLQQQHLYDAGVKREEITLPVNYPYFPPQYGPIQSFGDDGVPTYPYWQGPAGSNTETRSFPDEHSNYDYRVPGGSDYRDDPNYSYVHPNHPLPLALTEQFTPLAPWQHDNFRGHYSWPPSYTGGWDLYGPPSGFSYDGDDNDHPGLSGSGS